MSLMISVEWECFMYEKEVFAPARADNSSNKRIDIYSHCMVYFFL
jgi:hypothetical protein